LGLAISRRIVLAFGGRLWAASEPGAGSRFFVRLPLAPAAPHPVEAALPMPGTTPTAVVLIVHNDPDWQHLAAARARAAGWRVIMAGTGAEALACLHDVPVDLLATSLELPDMHCVVMLQQLQLEPLLFDLRAIIVGEPNSPGVSDYPAATTVEGVVERGRQLLAAPLRPIILLVENDPSAAQMLRRILRHAGYHCFVAPDARQGLTFARTRKPHLIITDYQMPGMDGLAFLTELRNDPILRKVPAIMLTGNVTSSLARTTHDLSVPLLAKPVEREVLLAEIRARL
jgi:DNA-binding response OmpR family regulator